MEAGEGRTCRKHQSRISNQDRRFYGRIQEDRTRKEEADPDGVLRSIGFCHHRRMATVGYRLLQVGLEHAAGCGNHRRVGVPYLPRGAEVQGPPKRGSEARSGCCEDRSIPLPQGIIRLSPTGFPNGVAVDILRDERLEIVKESLPSMRAARSVRSRRGTSGSWACSLKTYRTVGHTGGQVTTPGK